MLLGVEKAEGWRTRGSGRGVPAHCARLGPLLSQPLTRMVAGSCSLSLRHVPLLLAESVAASPWGALASCDNQAEGGSNKKSVSERGEEKNSLCYNI